MLEKKKKIGGDPQIQLHDLFVHGIDNWKLQNWIR